MGYSWNHLDPAVSRKQAPGQGQGSEDVKCSLIGIAVCAPDLVLLTGDLLWQCGYLRSRTTPEEAWGAPDAEERKAATMVAVRPWQELTPEENSCSPSKT